ncbi:Glycosyl transferase family 39 OS=Tsukamurella paurometabola (strain ATCC 8368 / DSM / CCUG 35730 / CIP 100753 / JCM 10117 / KCTC 9821 / NBRC 16120 / NCIMB 702349 / NCTC 13040) OX=521096 GN=Tpau_3143 PE=4 SV=1 [Tsukamurella paurometabola]|uniref:Glycosyl transferase family 39 n=1 Tax=Tsukamurella paurometabola (strain ATCC 8368 / DSM 20162 / CCUG 35730 / CIP 100753 / JCM 10117 / KCTC 9821 / NBRC 16120 / NCIMB 702349 / NCTC 13040) TaxID=521096 RepID=D5UV12_TSUPD|nr:glycosyltransferase family 39 protein [Tsukamurella paurometabola]ADG79730.1 glycosyl transferase family 39 [Tsukamurella paurometabola DSM 20162]SUP36966.1 Predicted membrane protein [Tsukamurella paurometabola]
MKHLTPRRAGVAALLALTAILYCWNLSINGYGNDFYAAAAQAGGLDWKAWLFGSLDPGNVITVDKPPAALWVTGLSVRIFGLSSWSVLLPQALMGVGTVGLVYLTTRRLLASLTDRIATGGALLAGAVCALTPAAVLIFRFNNPDALLVLLMTAAAYCTVRACQAASWRWLVACGAVLGFAFLTKMLQGLLVLPGFGLAYLLFAQTPWLRRARDLAFGTLAVVVSSGWYVLLTVLWPASSRPYIGGSKDGTFMDLVLGYNGLARIVGNSGGSDGSGGFPGGGRGPGGGATGTSFGGTPSLARLFSNEFGNEISWLLPAALLVLVVGIALVARRRLERDLALGLTVFGTWLVVTGVVFSFMSGTVHPYYTVALVPAIAVLVGGGAAVAWSRRSTVPGTAALVALVVAAGGWGVVRAWRAGYAWPALGIVVGVLTVAAVVALVVSRSGGRRAVAASLTLALLAGGIATAAFSISTAGTAHSGGVPTAAQTAKAGNGFPGGMRLGGDGADGGDRPAEAPDDRPDGGVPGERGADAAVVALLKTTGTDWAAAVSGAQSQGPLQLNSGRPVIAIGGFSGSDPAPTLTQFQQWVRDGRIGYYIAGGGFRRGGGESAIETWVKQNFTATTVGSSTVYQLAR